MSSSFSLMDMGLDRPLRLAARVLLSRRPFAAAFEPEPTERFTESFANGSALAGPSPILRLHEKKRDTLMSISFLLAEDMGLEPTGLLHLT